MSLSKQWISIFIMAAIFALSGSVFAEDLGEKAAAGAESTKDVNFITVDELKSAIARNDSIMIIDVRGKDYDTSQTKIKGAIRVAKSELESQLSGFTLDKEIVTYCACPSDGGAVKMARELQSKGFKRARVLKGGWNAWNNSAGQVETK
jgi:rhodanese-related sulfurtransferase